MLPGTDIVAAMLLFASQASGLPIPSGAQPVIETAPAATLVHEHWQAYTDWADGRIHLTAGWAPDTLGQCTLAHELTHWLQKQNGHSFAEGTQALEPQAYTVGAQCYDHFGDTKSAQWSRGRAAFCASHKTC